MGDFQDTICAIATAPGNGAIAVIRLSGAESFRITEKIFKAKKKNLSLSQQKGYQIVFGDILDQEEWIDEVLVSIFKAPHSYTGEDSIEISCHGSQYIQEEILRLLLQNGARLANAGEFTQRAFINGKMDLAQAEGVADLIAGESKAMHQLASTQIKGGFSKELEKLRNEMLQFISLIELELDFSEEDVTFADRTQLKKVLGKINKILSPLVQSFKYGNAIKNGINVAIIGKPNVGKSTLLNQILQEEKAIVSTQAGTTRDIIEDTLSIDGFLFRFIDTAGLRETEDAIEKIGIEKAYQKISKAKIILLLVDARDDLNEIQKQYEEIRQHINEQTLMLLLNKTDLAKTLSIKEIQDSIKDAEILAISAKSSADIHKLEQKLLDIIQKEKNNSNIIISNIRHYEALKNAEEAIERVKNNLSSEIPTDLLAMDLREAIRFVGEITGNISDNEILGNIFKNFCIGK